MSPHQSQHSERYSCGVVANSPNPKLGIARHFVMEECLTVWPVRMARTQPLRGAHTCYKENPLGSRGTAT
eukprot:77837-Amphidinium_carterae.1